MSDVATTTLLLQDTGTGTLYEFKLNNGSLKLSPVDQSGEGGSDIQVASSWPPVGRYRNGQAVSADVLNGPVIDLEERTNYLYDKLRAFDRNNPFAAVIISDAKLDPSDTPTAGDIVYIDASTKTCRKALATAELLDRFTSSGSAFAVGMVVSRSGTKGGVALLGRVDMSSPSYSLSRMVEDGETFRDGIYYLSAKQAGKITAHPTGPRVMVGQFFGKSRTVDAGAVHGDFAVIRVETRDFSEAHTHLSFRLAGVPAGDQDITGTGSSTKNVYLGYAPNAIVANPTLSGVVTPRLVFSGAWLSDDEDIGYTFVLGGAQGASAAISVGPGQHMLEFGYNPSVYLYWSREGASGEVEFTAFNQPMEIERGMFVELRRDEDLTSGNVVLDYASDDTNITDDIRTWNLTLPEAGRGWRDLSASEKAAFPAGSVPAFVYNIGYDSALMNAYPPIPEGGASLVVDGVEVMMRYDGHGLYSVEPDSVYWYGDKPGQAPWVDGGSPRQISLNMVRSVSTETGPVVSIRARDGSGIRVLRCGTNDTADVGDIELDFDPTGDAEDTGIAGYSVVKEGAGGKFLKGPVVERIVAGPGIRVNRWKDNPRGQGTVVLSTAAAGLQGDFEEVALQNAKQDLVGMFPYIRLLGWNSQSGGNVNSAFILKFHVPHDAAGDDPAGAKYKVDVSCSVFGTSEYSGSSVLAAGLRLEYSILPDLGVSGANVKDDLISTENGTGDKKYRDVAVKLVSSMDTGSGTVSYKAFDPVFIHTDDGSEDVEMEAYKALGPAIPEATECGEQGSINDTFGISPGDTVAIRVSRAPISSDFNLSEYTGSIGFMNFAWSLRRVAD